MSPDVYKSSLNSSSSNRETYKEFFECSRISFCSVQWFVFLSSEPLLSFGVHNIGEIRQLSAAALPQALI